MPQRRDRPCALDSLMHCGCAGKHRRRPWLHLLGYTDRAGRPVGPECKPPRSSSRCEDGTVRLCEKHVLKLEKYRSAIQGPSGGGIQPVPVQVAILLDAVAVTDRGAAPRPWSELAETTQLPEAMLMSFSTFATADQREIYGLKRKVAGLESRVTRLQAELRDAKRAA